MLLKEPSFVAGVERSRTNVTAVMVEHTPVHDPTPQRRKRGQQQHGRVTRRQLWRFVGMAQSLIPTQGMRMMIGMPLEVKKKDVSDHRVDIPAVLWGYPLVPPVGPLLAPKPVMLDVVDGL